MTRLRTQLLCLGYLVLVIAATVGLDRLIAERLFARPYDYVPAYRSFPEYAMGVKLNQFKQDRRRFDALFIGNSRTLAGVDPAVVDARMLSRGIRLRSYNLALPSVDPSFWPGFFEHYYARPPPRYLLLGILPRDLDARFTFGHRVTQEFYRSGGFRNRNMDGIPAQAEETLARLFVLRGRISDMRLITVSDLVAGKKLDLYEIHLTNDQGWAALRPQFREPKRALAATARRLARRHGRLRFELGPDRRLSLAKLNRWVRAGGGCLTLFTTPLLFDREPWGTIEMRRGFTRAVRRLADELPGVTFIDIGARLEPRLGLKDFGDGDHLDGRGATDFSRDLADALGPTITSDGCHGRGGTRRPKG